MDEGVRIVEQDWHTHPICEHGPTVLFERKNDEANRRYFACSAYRDRKDCAIYVPFDQWDIRTQDHGRLEENVLKAATVATEQQHLLEMVLAMEATKRCYCHTCGKFVIENGDKCQCTKLKHHLEYGIRNDQIDKPTTFLKAKSIDKKEAQYFFNELSLHCFTEMFRQLGITKVICIGAPRLHEHLKCQFGSVHIQSILLDFDQRFYSFHNRNGTMDFYHYNMFNNYFFGGEVCQQNFETFLECTDAEKCCIFTDPPFGGRTELLAAAFHTLNEKYRRKNNCHTILPIFLILPYFMENYVQQYMPEMTMFDYKVNYTNHDSYNDAGRKLGSAARLFSNVLPNLVRLPSAENYRQCRKCNRWVAPENKHCNRCQVCPSKNGAEYKHCTACELCVKPSYKHCYECGRCTQLENHRCAAYQSTLTCTICLRKGHNELNCCKWFDLCGRKMNAINRLKLKMRKTGVRTCLICFKNGHNEKKCTKRTELLREIRFLNDNYNLLSLDTI